MLGEEGFILELGEAAKFFCRVPHLLSAVDAPAETLAIVSPHGEQIHTQ